MAPHIPLPRELTPAAFLERPNRFLLRCRLESAPSPSDGDAGPADAGAGPGVVRERRPGNAAVVDVHLPDPGRLKELLLPGARVWLRYAAAPGRKTDWSAVLVEAPGGGLVSIDTTLPNRLIHRALEAEALDELAGWTLERSEFPLGRSRIDFLLRRDDGRRLALEVKSVTLVEEGVALFPDAVTARGARHLRELREVAGRDGWDAAVLFVLQRPDADRIHAAPHIDPEFAEALADARAAGVRILGRRCRVTLDRLSLGASVPAG